MKEGAFVKVVRHPITDVAQIYFSVFRDGRRFVARPVELIMDEVAEGEVYEPMLTFNREDAPQALRAFATALDDEKAALLPLIDAKDQHLQDMRRLVFKDEER